MAERPEPIGAIVALLREEGQLTDQQIAFAQRVHAKLT